MKTYDCSRAEENEVLTWEQVDDDAECQPNICELEPREDQREDVVLSKANHEELDG